jgi:ribosome-associated translation inhibitor RaiA
MHKQIAECRKIETAQKEFDKKLTRFQKVLDKLINYKVNVGCYKQEYSRFLTDKILNKELKPVLHIKVKDEEMQQECLKHLLNLMTKKWVGVSYSTFKL